MSLSSGLLLRKFRDISELWKSENRIDVGYLLLTYISLAVVGGNTKSIVVVRSHPGVCPGG